LKWLIFAQIALYILTEMLSYLLLESRQLLYIAASLRCPLTGDSPRNR